MKSITLSNTGNPTFVDNTDYEWLCQFRWRENSEGYAEASINGVPILMHRLILNSPKDIWSDHINRIRLDNQRHNLRNVTPRGNAQNRPPHMRSSKIPIVSESDMEYINTILDEMRGRLHATSDLELSIRLRCSTFSIHNLRKGHQNPNTSRLFKSILTYLDA
jgi:hypothetical protein